jgi:2-iminobutanoate/2-iminopropanoate deaminase
MRNNVFPEALSKRVVGGRLLYAPVVTFDLGMSTLVMISGLLSRDPEGNLIGAGDMGAQIHRVGMNIEIALASVGATLAELVRTVTYVTDIDEFFRHTEARHQYFGPGLPTSTTVQVQRLSDPRFMVEVEAMAIIPTSRLLEEKP